MRFSTLIGEENRRICESYRSLCVGASQTADTLRLFIWGEQGSPASTTLVARYFEANVAHFALLNRNLLFLGLRREIALCFFAGNPQGRSAKSAANCEAPLVHSRGLLQRWVERSEEMIFVLKEKDSDDMAFLHDLYRQSSPPFLVGWNAICPWTNCEPWTNQASGFWENEVSPISINWKKKLKSLTDVMHKQWLYHNKKQCTVSLFRLFTCHYFYK